MDKEQATALIMAALAEHGIDVENPLVFHPYQNDPLRIDFSWWVKSGELHIYAGPDGFTWRHRVSFWGEDTEHGSLDPTQGFSDEMLFFFRAKMYRAVELRDKAQERDRARAWKREVKARAKQAQWRYNEK